MKFMSPESALLVEESKEAGQKGLKNLRGFLEEIAGKLRKEGVPVRSNCRIEMDEFRGIYDIQEIEKDKQEIARIESKTNHNEEKVDQRLGEQLEMLKTGIFNKFLPSSFVTVRASRFDDIKNGIDNVIIDLESGNVVCALDEVGELANERFKEKQERILKINKKGGASLKYALIVDNGKIVPSNMLENIPVFCLALPPAYVQEGVRCFVPAIDKPSSSYEEKIFEYFVSLMDSQIKLMALTPEADKNFCNRVKTFRRAIDRIHIEKTK